MVSVSAARGTEEPCSCFHCGTLVILDVPVGSAVGVDQYVYTVGESFKGIKHVPHGTHVVSYAAYDAIGSRFGPVTAMFVEVPKVERSDDDRCAGMDHDTAWMVDSALHGPVLGWKWNGQEEILERIKEDSPDMARVEGMVRELRWDRELGSYVTMHAVRGQEGPTVSWRAHEEWMGLSGYIDSRVLKRVAPTGGNVCIIAEGDHTLLRQDGKHIKTEAEVALDEQLKDSTVEMSHSGASHAGRCHFTPVPQLIKNANLSPEDLTAWNMDKSKALDALLKDHFGNDESLFLGEFQFSFISFLLGHSIEGFLQWKHILALLFSCEEAVTCGRENLFKNALRIIYDQLSFSFHKSNSSSKGVRHNNDLGPSVNNAGGDAVFEQLLEDSFLKKKSVSFIRRIESESDAFDPDLYSRVVSLGRLISSSLSWECGPVQDVGISALLDDEDGPVIVNIDEFL